MTWHKSNSCPGRTHAKGKANPLVLWESLGEITDVDRATRPLLSKNAPRVYAEQLKTVKLDIAVVLGQSENRRADKQKLLDLALAGNTVLEVKQSTKAFLTVIGSLRAPLAPAAVRQGVEQRLAVPRGERGRITPFTPFTLLHRMGDVLQSDHRRMVTQIDFHLWEGWTFSLMPDLEELRAMASVGVDTLAGRNRWFTSPQEATSDLWAKYLLTGRIAYNPEAVGTRPWTPLELSARREIAAELHRVFPLWEAHSRGKIFTLV